MNIHHSDTDTHDEPRNAAPAAPRIKVAITHGDTNGVGYELILKTFAESTMLELCTPVVYGSAKVAAYHRKTLGSALNFHIIRSIEEAQEGALNLINCIDEEVKVDLGTPSAEAGRAALASLEAAVGDCREGKADVLVTAPINKATIQADSFGFSGHTEYLEDRLGGEALMVLTDGTIRVALLTTHLPLKDIAAHVTAENIRAKVKALYRSLRRDFLLPAPRIAVLGLNPHCGEDGMLGLEEQNIIRPAIEELAAEGMPVFGPYPADGFFGAATYKSFDGVLAMYHDQGLAPFKALSMDGGVNFTAGLPIVRTSPDHGTAYDIAGKGLADERSFREAIFTAIDIFRNRAYDDEAYQNPLPKLYHDRREDERRPRGGTPRANTDTHTEQTEEDSL